MLRRATVALMMSLVLVALAGSAWAAGNELKPAPQPAGLVWGGGNRVPPPTGIIWQNIAPPAFINWQPPEVFSPNHHDWSRWLGWINRPD